MNIDTFKKAEILRHKLIALEINIRDLNATDSQDVACETIKKILISNDDIFLEIVNKVKTMAIDKFEKLNKEFIEI